MGLGKCTGWPFHDIDPRSRLWRRLAKICLSERESENHSSDHYKTWQLCCHSHGYYLIRFWQFSFLNFGCVFFQCQTLFWPYLRNGWSDWCETKRKCIGWILDTICDLDLWPHWWPWPWMFQGQISKELYRRNCWSDWCEMKRKWVIWYWADCMTLPFDHNHNLDLGVSRSESEIALSQKWGGRWTMNEKDGSHPVILTSSMILTCVTMVGSADVPDSDRGDFRCRCAVDISGLTMSPWYSGMISGEI